MKQIFEKILSLIAHAQIILGVMLITFYITDRFNRPMAFINNDITKALLFVLSIFAIVQSVYHIYLYRKKQMADYEATQKEEQS